MLIFLLTGAFLNFFNGVIIRQAPIGYLHLEYLFIYVEGRNISNFNAMILNVRESKKNGGNNYGLMIGIQEDQYLVFLPMEDNLNSTITVSLKIKWNFTQSKLLYFKFFPISTELYVSVKNNSLFHIEMSINHFGFPSRTDLVSFMEIKKIIIQTFDDQITTLYDIKLKYQEDKILYIFTVDKYEKKITCIQMIKLSRIIQTKLIKNLLFEDVLVENFALRGMNPCLRALKVNFWLIFILPIVLVLIPIVVYSAITYYRRKRRYHLMVKVKHVN
ncbi:hypothetical protein HZS_5663 [Henneguya salminicola]|nr:hypothetical protein HZS_5663 [Henneguya salminicola]